MALKIVVEFIPNPVHDSKQSSHARRAISIVHTQMPTNLTQASSQRLHAPWSQFLAVSRVVCSNCTVWCACLLRLMCQCGAHHCELAASRWQSLGLIPPGRPTRSRRNKRSRAHPVCSCWFSLDTSSESADCPCLSCAASPQPSGLEPTCQLDRSHRSVPERRR
jgi:hypothetical protein